MNTKPTRTPDSSLIFAPERGTIRVPQVNVVDVQKLEQVADSFERLRAVFERHWLPSSGTFSQPTKADADEINRVLGETGSDAEGGV